MPLPWMFLTAGAGCGAWTSAASTCLSMTACTPSSKDMYSPKNRLSSGCRYSAHRAACSIHRRLRTHCHFLAFQVGIRLHPGTFQGHYVQGAGATPPKSRRSLSYFLALKMPVPV